MSCEDMHVVSTFQKMKFKSFQTLYIVIYDFLPHRHKRGKKEVTQQQIKV